MSRLCSAYVKITVFGKIPGILRCAQKVSQSFEMSDGLGIRVLWSAGFISLLNFGRSVGNENFLSLLVYDKSNLVVLSVQYCVKLIAVVIPHSQNPATSISSVAASSSSFGMLSCLIGAFFVLLITYHDVEGPSALVVLTYTMAAIALVERQ